MSCSEKPRVSVIIPAFNAEEYAGECLQNLLGQTLHDIEIIFVDDGSTDSTLSIAQSLAQKDPRLTVLACAHEGAAAARNQGLAKARGEYLSFLDVDDVFDSQMLEKTWTFAHERQSDIAVFSYTELDTSTGEIRHNSGIARHHSGITGNYASGPNAIDASVPTAWNKLFKRDFILKHGLRFQNLRTCNDVFFTKSAFASAESIHFLDEELLTYRCTSNNISSTRHLCAENIIEALTHTKSYLEKKFENFDRYLFYKKVFCHIVYEYEQFPDGYNKYPYIKKVYRFLPLKLRIKFLRKVFKYELRKRLSSRPR